MVSLAIEMGADLLLDKGHIFSADTQMVCRSEPNPICEGFRRGKKGDQAVHSGSDRGPTPFYVQTLPLVSLEYPGPCIRQHEYRVDSDLSASFRALPFAIEKFQKKTLTDPR